MTSKLTLRRQDQSIQLGPRHGYRIEGDHVFINAEIHLPPGSDGVWTLELWATELPHRWGPLTGSKIAEIALDLPTPIGPYVHNVDTRTAARLPLQGRPHAMVLALVEHGPNGQSSVHAFANYADSQTFIAPSFEGSVGYEIQGDEVVLEAEGIFNPRAAMSLSGTLSVELWAYPLAGTTPSMTTGLRLAASEVAPVAGQSRLPRLERRVPFNEPPVGRHQIAMLLCEWTHADGYVARDRRDFACVYERQAPESAVASEAQAPVTAAAPVPASVRPAERLRLVPTAAPKGAATVAEVVKVPEVAKAPEVAKSVEAKPAETQTPALLSIQTASVEELAKVKGLNLKLAKEIIMARPFTSLADLVRVRGIGQKTIDRVKGFLKV